MPLVILAATRSTCCLYLINKSEISGALNVNPLIEDASLSRIKGSLASWSFRFSNIDSVWLPDSSESSQLLG